MHHTYVRFRDNFKLDCTLTAIEHHQSSGSQRIWDLSTFLRLSEHFLVDFGEGWGGIWEDLGGSWEDFYKIFGGILERFGAESKRDFKNLTKATTESLNGTPALIREASQCAGVPRDLSVIEQDP